MTNEERRRSPRLSDDHLSLKLNIGNFDAVAHTLNLSATGVYCKVDKELPLMSRVKLVLMLPDTAKDDRSAKNIEVEGVVVREHPVVIDGQTKHYDVAIFFDNLSPKSSEIISNYIASRKA
jgi:hypothetical protein